jgi:monoamine oxidase
MERLAMMAGAIEWILDKQQQWAAAEKTAEAKKLAQRRFADGVLALSRAFALAGSSDEARGIRDEVGFFQAIRAALVKSAAGTFRARRVIVAMSPAIAGRIHYPAGLSAARRQLHRTVKMGSIGKFQAVYDAPFWRDQGFSGQVIGDGAPIDVTFESYSQGKHFLMGFISDVNMRRLDDVSPRRFMNECMGSFVRYFGPKARDLAIDRGFMRWDHDPWSWGGPTGVSSPGLLTAAGPALRDPVGPIHWAGTEAATYWQGYMDGAVSSGYRAADEVLRDLG